MNSTTKIIAGVAVFALLFAGIGFAVQYTAETTSTSNQLGVAYITLNDGVTAASDDAKLIGINSYIGFDTSTNENGVVTYTLKENTITEGKVKLVNNGVNETKVTITIKETSSSLLTDTYFDLKIDNVAATYNATNGWSAEIDLPADSKDVSVAFTAKSTAAFTTEVLEEIADQATFEFKISAAAGTA